tara:strand:- start:846 stop:1337 length:492 start_codon:yes stop_codon:yes gene_type:complete
MAQFNIIQPKEAADSDESHEQYIINIIVADDMETAESVIDTDENLIVENSGDEGIGWVYNPDNSKTPFTPPAVKVPPGFDQAAFKAHLKMNVKEEARVRIEALAWKIEKATEQDALNGTTTINDVYAEREAIRAKSNAIEADIDAETDDLTVFTMGTVVKFDE